MWAHLNIGESTPLLKPPPKGPVSRLCVLQSLAKSAITETTSNCLRTFRASDSGTGSLRRRLVHTKLTSTVIWVRTRIGSLRRLSR